MDTKEKILNYIRANGPSLPTTIAKKLEDNSFFISAHLSEMKDLGKIKISNIKIGGGSPLYYVPGQEPQLEKFSDNLGEKERKVYELLKEKKVLKDSSLVPVFRAAIRTIKDFAFPLSVNFKNEKVVFWKWKLLPNEEAEKIIRNILGKKKEEKKVQPEIKKLDKQEKLTIKQEEILPQKKVQPEEQKTPEKQIEKEEKFEKPGKTNEPPKKESDFHEEVKKYFIDNNIKIIEENLIRKTEADYVVELPSPVGTLKYFVKSKSKKKLNEGDLSSVFIQAQTKRLPALFLAKGDLTKKAEEMLESEFRGMKYKKI